MSSWLWGLVLVYLSVLFFAALWSAVERTRSRRERARRLAYAEPASDQPEQIAAPLVLEAPEP
jgi:hypothetical protein